MLLACLAESAATWTLAGIDPGSTVIVPLAFEGQAAQFSVKRLYLKLGAHAERALELEECVFVARDLFVDVISEFA